MPSNATPEKFQRAVRSGFQRLENFRKARLMYLRSYVGQYYDRDRGTVGTEPLNLTFVAMSSMVPNLVMNAPAHVVTTPFSGYRGYGRLLRLALDTQARKMRLSDTIRRWLVDSLFTLGVVKTGLAQSDTLVALNPYDDVDPGTVYTEVVNFDNFVFDPDTRAIEEGTFIGDKIRVPRTLLLDSGLYANDLVERLPETGTDTGREAADLSRRNLPDSAKVDLHDYVDVVECYVPSIQAIVTVPAGDMSFPRFLRIADYYGPSRPTGPYTLLALTPPVPDNPLPVAPIGVWHDLHILANDMAVKITEQARRQKDVLAYRRAAAEDAEEIVGAKDGEAIAVDDPASVQVLSFGGQQRSNEAHIQQLMFWWNMVSGNIEAISGSSEASGTATQAQLLSANRSVRMEDLRDIVYGAVGREAEMRAWYLHTDPLIEVPLSDRRSVPAQYTAGPQGEQVMATPPRIEDVTVLLTPEVRRGDFLDFTFAIKPKSMSRLDPILRSQRMMEFATKVIPAVAAAAQTCMAMGVPFSFSKMLQLVAEEMDIEWLDEVFYDPEFQMNQAAMMLKGPSIATSKGTPASPMLPAIQQNQQPGNVASVATNEETQNREPQRTAAESQRATR